MTISATVIADSISPDGVRLTTFQLRYPRFIHAEFMTHRLFSRNASSSRAIPVERMIEDLRRDPAMPVYWGSNKPGMQAGEEIPEYGTYKGIKISPRGLAAAEWLDALDCCISAAEKMVSLGLHKQIANRILEPWAHINVVCTATDYENFYALRRHADAQPEIKALADAMWEAQQASTPELLQPGDWHLPYVRQEDHELAMAFGNTMDGSWLEVLKRISVARCARVSYLTHDGRQTTVEEDLKLFERLVGSQPLHASPAEHQATPDKMHPVEGAVMDWLNPRLHGNFRGWIQYRKKMAGEFIPG